RPVEEQSPSEITDLVMEWADGRDVEVVAPLVRGRKGEFRDLFDEARQEGYVRARVDGALVDLEDPPELDKRKNHDISVVVDRMAVRERDRDRLADSVETALGLAGGTVQVDRHGSDGEQPESKLFSEEYACPVCGISIPELEPRQFSFNSPYGACPECDGLGVRQEPEASEVTGGDRISILEGVILPWGPPPDDLKEDVLPEIAEKYNFDLNEPWGNLSESQKTAVLEGDPELDWEGALEHTRRRYEETDSDNVRNDLEDYMREVTCPACDGGRLKPESRAVTVNGTSLPEVVELPVSRALELFADWRDEVEEAEGPKAEIVKPIYKEVHERLRFMDQVGLGYLTLNRSADTLAGGEAQRIRLATQIGSRLVGVLYVLDEPSIGLHQRDNDRLLDTLEELRDLGNTVIVVEHDEETIRAADHVVDLGPRAGRHGGEVLVSGGLDDLVESEESLTGAYLRGDREI
ncbi:MAG: excinuclease ABC subunit UvrA, partial [Gemmatimonadota bacterium]